ncbi:ROK family protein, partial [Sulfurihydrogenibium sp.]|uniref:ROK family protein n=1 Tax=Sulfurihydrogenibium sp. TaxID=2053621 RepID=UPI00260E1E84
MKRFLGIDIGGTFVKVAFKKGQNIETEKISIKDVVDDKNLFLNLLADIIKKYNPDRLAVAVAGLVDKKTGLLTNSPNLKSLEGLNIKSFIEENFKIETLVENDANVAAYGEYVYGNGKDGKVLVCLTLGTG